MLDPHFLCTQLGEASFRTRITMKMNHCRHLILLCQTKEFVHRLLNLHSRERDRNLSTIDSMSNQSQNRIYPKIISIMQKKIDPDNADLVDLASLLPCQFEDGGRHYGIDYDFGYDYDWGKQELTVSFRLCCFYNFASGTSL